MRTRATRLLALSLAGALAACANAAPETPYQDPDDVERYRYGSLTSEEGGFNLFDFGDGDEPAALAASPIGVNSYLWRASLDTVSFMPVNSADPFGGVILTDWYSPPETGDERFKLNVYILDRQLRANGIRVAVFRQVREGDGGWVDAPVTQDTAVTLEDAILTRARELRIDTISQ